MLLFNELLKIGCADTSQQEKLLANLLSKRHLQILTRLPKMHASLDQGDVQQPLVVEEAEVEEILKAEVATETTALVPQVVQDHRVQEEADLDPDALKRIHPKWKVKMPVSTVAKMDTRFATVSKIQTTNASIVDNLDPLHEIAVKNLEDEVEAEANLGEVVAEDKNVALFEEGEEKVQVMWERELCSNLPRKKIPLWHWARWASRWTSKSRTMDH